MKKTFVITAAFSAATATSYLRADTSYLLVQGPFGSVGAEATFKWRVNYPTGSLVLGRDLLDAVFGTPVLNGSYADAFGGTYEKYSAGNTAKGVDYIDFNSSPGLGNPFVIAFSFNGTSVQMQPDYSVGFSYYAAGGGGAHSYANSGAWTYSDDGTNTRTLANGSYDGWVYGGFGTTINGADNAPAAANFSSATVINVVPEPASAGLLAAGAVLAMVKRRRTRP